jgi:murein L,D-transpeptidase YcbB/YkuD
VEPALFDPETFVYPQDVERGQVLTGAAGSADIDAFIESFKPSSDRYDRTRLALEDYRRLAAGGGWPNVPEGETLKPGTTDPRVQALRSRLAVTGEVSGPATGDPAFFDADLESAVRAFQARHGLEVDGKVGRESLAALNVPVERRIDQLILNLERRRWMPDDFGDRFVFVNLADFHLKVVVASGGEEDTIFDSRVVVGTPYFRTPVFSDEITYIEINPYWTVPPSIARNELLPKIKKDPGYLAKNEYVLFDGWGESAKTLDPQNVDWTQVRADNFGYKIRQEPGDRNALGRIKFMFPNQFNVYLHDTPSKSLFGRASRAFSHGCVRVHEPITFAEFVLNGQEGWDEAKVREVIDSGKRTVVPLQTPLPVHLTYLTAWVNKDGIVHFREDIYGRDALLAKVLLADR